MKANLPLVRVRWEDPSSSTTRTYTLDDWRTYHQPAVVETLGWLGRDDERGVSVFNEIYLEEGQEMFRGHTMILRSLILDMKVIKAATKKRTRKAATEGVAVDAEVRVGSDQGQ